MQMTQALHELVRAHDQDRGFPYMDFVGAFLQVERLVRRDGGRARKMLDEADPVDLLGVPLGYSSEDLKLGYVLRLLRQHALQLMDELARLPAPQLVH